jgi:hypothetical protein
VVWCEVREREEMKDIAPSQQPDGVSSSSPAARYYKQKILRTGVEPVTLGSHSVSLYSPTLFQLSYRRHTISFNKYYTINRATFPSRGPVLHSNCNSISVSRTFFCASSVLFVERTRFRWSTARYVACPGSAPGLVERTTFGKLDEERE